MHTNQSGTCKSFDDCRAFTGKKGFNVGLAIVPQTVGSSSNCRALYCLTDRCDDAYQFPTDDWKTHDCPDTTAFDVVFCPPGSTGNAFTSAASTPAATSSTSMIVIPSVSSKAYVRANFAYRGPFAGSVEGSYAMVSSLRNCQRQRVFMRNRVGPLSEEVSLVFRGPMELFNIAVYIGSVAAPTSATAWQRVSWYTRGGAASNLVFLNNKNIDYSGVRGPQGFATADGKLSSSRPQPFSGTLEEAAYPWLLGGGPGVDTGVEVNIMTGKPCDPVRAYDCPGFHGDTWSYHGWGGGRKVFVTKVQMPWGKKPNLPAIWMLNAQVLWSGQYGCNCRGMGAAGGCGELDIAEVLETNSRRDRVSTHYYFYDGAAATIAPGGDNFATRPVDQPTTYITVLDNTNSAIKILEVPAFNFDQTVLSDATVQQWINS